MKQLFKNSFKESMILVLSNLMLNRYANRKFCVWKFTLFRFLLKFLCLMMIGSFKLELAEGSRPTFTESICKQADANQ